MLSHYILDWEMECSDVSGTRLSSSSISAHSVSSGGENQMTKCKLFRSLGNLQWHPADWDPVQLEGRDYSRIHQSETEPNHFIEAWSDGITWLYRSHPSLCLSRRNITWHGDGKI